MDSELSVYAESIGRRLAAVCDCVAGLSEEQLNWQPPATGANSICALAMHVAGNARAWILGIACGAMFRRDRPAEFAATGDAASVVAHVNAIADDVAAAIRKLDPARLDLRLLPSHDYWGEGTPHEISVREAFTHVIEHASLHLGHLQLTRDLALARTV